MRNFILISFSIFFLAGLGPVSYLSQDEKKDDGAQEITDILLLNSVRAFEKVEKDLGKINLHYNICEKTFPTEKENKKFIIFPSENMFKGDSSFKAKGTDTSSADLHILYGIPSLKSGTKVGEEETFGYLVSYDRPITKSKKIRLGLTYLNEGHIEGHHRDDFAVQIWRQWQTPNKKLKVSFGLGPGVYLDTAKANNPDGYINPHGVALLASLFAQLELGRGFYAEGRINKNFTLGTSFDSTSFLFGIGYRLPKYTPSNKGEDLGELRILSGQSVLNNFQSPKGRPIEIQYNKKVSGPLGVQISYLNEGDIEKFRRQGLALQASLSKKFGKDRLELGAALGPYFYQEVQAELRKKVALMLTLSADYKITQNVGIHASFNRVTSSNSRDSDVFMIGISYRF